MTVGVVGLMLATERERWSEVELVATALRILTQLADAFAHRLSVPGWPAAEIAPLFEEAQRKLNA